MTADGESEAGTMSVAKMNMASALNDALRVAMELDPEVFLLGEDIADPIGGVMKVTKGLSTRFGESRVRPTPIAEQAIVGAAIGAALAGMRPVAEIMIMDFFAVCMDQVANHAAKLRYMSGGRTPVPLTIRSLVGGGNRAGAQHTQNLEAWLMHVPGLKVVVPSTAYDAKGLMLSAVFDDDPVIFLENSRLYRRSPEEVPEGDYRIPLGQANIRRPGTDLCVVTWGRVVPDVLEAAERISSEGIEVEVVDLRTLVPFDHATVLNSAAKCSRVLVAQSGVRWGGPGAEIAATISEHLGGELAAPVGRVGAPYSPNPSGNLERLIVPDTDRILQAMRNIL